MATGYEDIDKLMQEQNSLLEQQQNKQNQIVDLGVQKVQNEVNKQKADYDREATVAGKQLYTDMRKQLNPYGASAEELASQGLANSGYAESSKVQIYNTYQKNATALMTETQKLKAEADFQMNQALIDADVQKAQNALVIYQQKAQLALQEYDMKFSREQFDWQKQQAEREWQYQTERDAISDQRWQMEYEKSLKKAKGSTTGGYNPSIDLGGGSEPEVTQQNLPQLSEGAQQVLQTLLNQSGDSKSLVGKIQGTQGLTEQGAMDMIRIAKERGVISQDDYDILKSYFE